MFPFIVPSIIPSSTLVFIHRLDSFSLPCSTGDTEITAEVLIFLKLKDYELKRNDDENIVKKHFEFDEEYQGDEILNRERLARVYFS